MKTGARIRLYMVANVDGLVFIPPTLWLSRYGGGEAEAMAAGIAEVDRDRKLSFRRQIGKRVPIDKRGEAAKERQKW